MKLALASSALVLAGALPLDTAAQPFEVTKWLCGKGMQAACHNEVVEVSSAALETADNGVFEWLYENRKGAAACFGIAKGLRSEAKAFRAAETPEADIKQIQTNVYGGYKKALDVVQKYAGIDPKAGDYMGQLERAGRRLKILAGMGQIEFGECLANNMNNMSACGESTADIKLTGEMAAMTDSMARGLPEVQCYDFIQAVQIRWGR